jgi:hypothetical protein
MATFLLKARDGLPRIRYRWYGGAVVSAYRDLSKSFALSGLALACLMLGCMTGVAAAAGKPSIESVKATNVTQYGATLEARINPNGAETHYEGQVEDCAGECIDYGRFIYGALPGTENAQVVSASLIEAGFLFEPRTERDYWFEATNAFGATRLHGYFITASLTAGIPPSIDTLSASRVTQEDATLEAAVDPEGLETEYEILFDEGGHPRIARGNIGDGETDVPVGVDLAESAEHPTLEPNHTYEYSIQTRNSAGESFRRTTFTTLPGPPSVTTGEASSVDATSATLTGTVDPVGASLSNCYFEYGTTPSYGSSMPCSSMPEPANGGEPVSASVAELKEATTYYYRLVAGNADATIFGMSESFTTPSVVPQSRREQGASTTFGAYPAGAPGTPSQGLLGVSAKHPSEAQIRRALAGALAQERGHRRVKNVFDHDGYAVRFQAPAAGTFTIAFHWKPKHGKPVVVADARQAFNGPGGAGVNLRFTAAGRRLIRQASPTVLAAANVFTPAGGAATADEGVLTLAR